MHLIPVIPMVVHMSWSMQYWWRCDYNTDNYWIWKVCAQGGLERPLELYGMLYKWPSHCGIHPSSGPIIQFPKEDKFVLFKIARFHIGCNLFTPDLLFYCMDFSQIWYHWNAIFEENPVPYVMEDKDHSLWKTSSITEIAPLRSIWRYWWLSNPDFSYLDVPPSAQDILLQFGTDLGEIWVILGQKHHFH